MEWIGWKYQVYNIYHEWENKRPISIKTLSNLIIREPDRHGRRNYGLELKTKLTAAILLILSFIKLNKCLGDVVSEHWTTN